MRYVDVRLRCSYAAIDGCTETGLEGEDVVTSVVIQLNRGKPREIDLCKGHREALVDGLLTKLMKDGRTVEAPSSGSKAKSTKTSVDSASSAPAEVADDLVCQIEDCNRDGRPLRNKAGLAQHVIRSHGYESLAAYYDDTNKNGTG